MRSAKSLVACILLPTTLSYCAMAVAADPNPATTEAIRSVPALVQDTAAVVGAALAPTPVPVPVPFHEGKPKKVVIFYSSIGSGHISAARAMEKAIKDRSPDTQVTLKNIRDFIKPRIREPLGEKLYWFVVKNSPAVFDAQYHLLMDRGNKVTDLSNWGGDYYGVKAIKAYLQQEKPDTVVAAHYGSAIELGKLRQMGALDDVKLAWLHTDYNEGFFPRISQYVDQTFLGHRELEKIWANAGVPPEKVRTTGLPVNPKLFEPLDRDAFLESQGLSPNVPLITLASGAEGVGDFPKIVKSISSAFGDRPVQIVAVAAKNKQHVKDLTALRSKLPQSTKLVVKGYVPQEDLLNFIKSSSLYITKSGGLSPTEGFAINRPMILLDVYGGHERENCRLFERLGLAQVNEDPAQIGKQVLSILDNPKAREGMMTSQAAFREQMDIHYITDFVFDDGKKEFHPVVPDFGKENGTAAPTARAALKKLDNDAPADVELLLSESMTKGNRLHDKLLEEGGNPFGHLAIRIGDDVYTANQGAKQSENSGLLYKTTLESYLFGTRPDEPNLEHASNYGLAYGRHSMGLRIRGVTSEQRGRMLEEIGKINQEWRDGASCFDWKNANCADYTKRILSAAGIPVEKSSKLMPTMPIETFDDYFKKLEGSPNYGLDLVWYSKLFDSKSPYRFSTFPISIQSPVRSVSALWNSENQRAGYPIGKRLASYPGGQIAYENIDKTSVGDTEAKAVADTRDLADRRQELQRTEARLATKRDSIIARGLDSDNVRNKVAAALENLGPDGVKAYREGGLGSLSPDKRKIAEDLDGYIKSSDKELAGFQRDYDAYQADKIDYYLDETRSNIDALKLEIKNHVDGKQAKSVQKLISQVEEAYKTYEAKRGLYGQPKDVERITAHRAFYSRMRDLYAKVDNALGRTKDPAQAGWLNRLKAMIRGLLDTVYTAARLVPAASDVVYNLFAKPDTPPGQTPLNHAIYRTFGKLGEVKGFNVNVSGTENIPKLTDDKTVNVFALVHGHPQLDQIALAKLVNDGQIRNFALFGAADSFAPKLWADKLDANDHFIVVGRGSDKPIKKTEEILEKKGIRNFVIYPEGSVSAGVYDTRPPREKFSWGLLNMMRNKGYKVNVIPISMPDDFRFNTVFAPSDPSYGKNLKVIVHKALTPDMLDVLERAGDDQTVNHLMREAWMGDFDHGNGKVAGSPTLANLDREVRSFFKGHFEPKGARCGQRIIETLERELEF